MGKEVFHPQAYDTNSFTMNWTMEQGGKVPPHIHEHMDEYFTVTKGEVLFIVNGQKTLKKAGEAFFIPRGTPHSIANTCKGQIGLSVKYSPCADTHRMFEILTVLGKGNTVSMMNMLQYFYLYPKLGLRPFSSMHPKFAMNITLGIINVIGNISGWGKLVQRFR